MSDPAFWRHTRAYRPAEPATAVEMPAWRLLLATACLSWVGLEPAAASALHHAQSSTAETSSKEST
jgi:hypothetical protein